MKAIILFTALILCAGCNIEPQPNQALRRQIFMQCLEKIPQGPSTTKYNDWSEVVEECGQQAYYISLRLAK